MEKALKNIWCFKDLILFIIWPWSSICLLIVPVMVLQRYRYLNFIITSLQKLLLSSMWLCNLYPQPIFRALCHRFLSFNFHLIYTKCSETRASSSLSNIKHSTPPISVCASLGGNSLLILSLLWQEPLR